MTRQVALFNPDHRAVQYIADNGTFELTFDGAVRTFWLNQKQIAELFGLERSVVTKHVQNFKESRSEDVSSVCANFTITASDGKRYEVEHYNHQVVMYVGYRAQQTERTVAFQRFVEKAVSDALEAASRVAIRKAARRRDQSVTSYILAGKTSQWAELRTDQKESWKAYKLSVNDGYKLVYMIIYVYLVG